MYDVIRKSLLLKYYWKQPNMFKFIELMKSDSKHMINLGCYVQKAFKIRSQIMYNN